MGGRLPYTSALLSQKALSRNTVDGLQIIKLVVWSEKVYKIILCILIKITLSIILFVEDFSISRNGGPPFLTFRL